MKRWIAACVAAISLAAVAVVAQDTYRTETVIWHFVNGVRTGALNALTATGTLTLLGGAVTVTTDSTGDAEVNLPENSIGADELAGMRFDLIFCGQAAENGTIVLSPAAGVNGVDFGDGVDYSIAGTACDAIDGGTEATQDLVVFPSHAVKVMGMYCITNGTLGAAETLVFTLRSAAADLTPSITCSLAEAGVACRSIAGTTTDVAAGATLAVQAVQVSDNSDDDLWCQVSVMLK